MCLLIKDKLFASFFFFQASSHTLSFILRIVVQPDQTLVLLWNTATGHEGGLCWAFLGAAWLISGCAVVDAGTGTHSTELSDKPHVLLAILTFANRTTSWVTGESNMDTTISIIRPFYGKHTVSVCTISSPFCILTEVLCRWETSPTL